MSYQYDHDCPFEAFITNLGKYNEGKLVGEWVKFPTTTEEMEKVFERIGIGSKDAYGQVYEEWFITDYDCYVKGLNKNYDFGEYESLNELNYLAAKIEEMAAYEYESFEAILQVSDYTGSLKDLINLTDNLDKYEVYPSIENEEDLGRYYAEEMIGTKIPDSIKDYFDYEAYGRDMSINEGGVFTEFGYVRDAYVCFEEKYDGETEHIPESYKVMNFHLSEEKEEDLEKEEKSSLLKSLEEKKKEVTGKEKKDVSEKNVKDKGSEVL